MLVVIQMAIVDWVEFGSDFPPRLHSGKISATTLHEDRYQPDVDSALLPRWSHSIPYIQPCPTHQYQHRN